MSFADADGGELFVGVEDDGSITQASPHKDELIQAMVEAPQTHVHKGTPLPNPTIVRFKQGNYGARIGLTLHPEDLRRTCAMLCQPADVDLDSIRVLLGHSTLAITERYLWTGRMSRLFPASD